MGTWRTAVIVCFVALWVFACAQQKKPIAIEPFYEPVPEAEYDVIYLENRAEPGDVFIILDIEGDPYEFAPQELVPERYRREERVSTPEALERAERVLETETYPVRMRRIMTEDTVIGYELRRDFDNTVYPVPNILHVEYVITEDGKISIRAVPIPLRESAP
jgi:hypothetical protein